MQIGNLHPLLVHLPIGIIILAFLMELWMRAVCFSALPSKIKKEASGRR